MQADEIKQKILASMSGFIVYKNGSYANVTVTPIANTTYTSQYFTPFNDASWDFGNMGPIWLSVMGDFFGQPLGNQITAKRKWYINRKLLNCQRNKQRL